MSNPPSKEPTKPVVYAFKDSHEVSRGLADFVIKAQDEAIKKQNVFRIAVSGGSLPKVLGEHLINNDRAQWDKWQLFFADERVVPLDNPDSNYKAVYDELLSKVSIPRENVHTINEKLLNDPEALADDYEKQIISNFVGKSTIAFPRFDLILLGIGPDGHTCSLFPGHPLLDEEDSWVTYLKDSPKPPPVRTTLTFPVLNHSARVAFVTTGEGKADILPRVIDQQDQSLPSARVKVISPGIVYFFADSPAISKVQYPKTEYTFA